MLLVGLPLLVVAIGGTFVLTKEVSAKEGLARTMGTSQAYITQESGGRRIDEQSADGASYSSGDRLARPLPGQSRGAQATASSVARVTGGAVHAVQTDISVNVDVGGRTISALVLGIDGRDRAYRGMATLESGRWPRTADEVLVSRAGVAEGLPASGTLTLVESSGSTTTVRVVGRADTPNAQAIVRLPHGLPTGWLLSQDRPVSWREVLDLNRYGLVVQSRAIVNDPTEANRMGAESDSSPVPAAVWVLLGTGLVVVIALLAGPAFAASASRHRRALGLLASNGATRRQLRRYLLAQAILLGALSAVVSLLLGIALGTAAVRLYAHWTPQQMAPGPLDIRWKWGLLLVAVAIVASVVAAFIPAVVASRLNLIEVLRGQVSRQRVRAGWPIGGVVLGCLGGMLLTYCVTHSRGVDSGTDPVGVAGVVVGGVALFAGVLMAVPWLLLRISKVAAPLPAPVRIAARDIGRQRGRAVATIGAVLATVAVLTGSSIAYASSDRFDASTYQPQLPSGQGMITVPGATAAHVAHLSARIRQELPRAKVTLLKQVVDNRRSNSGQRQQLSAAYTSGCTPTQALGADPNGSCTSVAGGAFGDSVVAGTPAQLRSIFRLSDSDVLALTQGKALVQAVNQGSDPAGGTMRFVSGTGIVDAQGFTAAQVKVTGSGALPYLYSDQQNFTFARQTGSDISYTTGLVPAVLVSTVAAQRLPGGVHPAALMIDNPGGIPRSAEAAIDSVTGGNDQFYVERGYRSDTQWIFLGIVVVFGLLVLIATLISTALSQAESRADSATLASLGAPPRMRRLIVGSNAALVGLVGALLGIVVGAVPGIAVAYPLTTQSLADGTQSAAMISIPWQPLVVVAVAVPLLAGLLAGAVTRGRPPMTRRLA